MPAPDDSPELPEGFVLLDRYAVIDRVGGGGMATIYRAHDTRLDRIVCVKLLRNELSDMRGVGSATGELVYEATYAHFLQEARALCKLAHPNTLRIYDFGFLDVGGRPDGDGTVGARPFYVSEFLDGGNLEQYVRARGPLGAGEVLAILDRIAGAVGEAHAAGIIHRDIKPSNILFSRVGDVLMPKLADFGIARSVQVRDVAGERAAAGRESDPPVPLFSPRWAAPEQLSTSEEGPYTDVYSLALVTAFMLTGRSIFNLADATSTYEERVRADALVHARLEEMPHAPETALTPEVEEVLLHALRADRRARVPSPVALYEALSVALGGARALPGGLTLSGGVPDLPRGRAPHESVTLEPGDEKGERGLSAPSAEHRLEVLELTQELTGGWRARIVETDERVDLGAPTDSRFDVRFRVTLLPGGPDEFRVHIKGLNCFVARPGSPPTPAIVAVADGSVELVSMQKEHLASLAFSFGRVLRAREGERGERAERGERGEWQAGGAPPPETGARVFPIDKGQVVVPFPLGVFAIALQLERSRELIVVCRRS